MNKLLSTMVLATTLGMSGLAKADDNELPESWSELKNDSCVFSKDYYDVEQTLPEGIKDIINRLYEVLEADGLTVPIDTQVCKNSNGTMNLLSSSISLNMKDRPVVGKKFVKSHGVMRETIKDMKQAKNSYIYSHLATIVNHVIAAGNDLPISSIKKYVSDVYLGDSDFNPDRLVVLLSKSSSDTSFPARELAKGDKIPEGYIIEDIVILPNERDKYVFSNGKQIPKNLLDTEKAPIDIDGKVFYAPHIMMVNYALGSTDNDKVSAHAMVPFYIMFDLKSQLKIGDTGDSQPDTTPQLPASSGQGVPGYVAQPTIVPEPTPQNDNSAGTTKTQSEEGAGAGYDGKPLAGESKDKEDPKDVSKLEGKITSNKTSSLEDAVVEGPKKHEARDGLSLNADFRYVLDARGITNGENVLGFGIGLGGNLGKLYLGATVIYLNTGSNAEKNKDLSFESPSDPAGLHGVYSVEDEYKSFAVGGEAVFGVNIPLSDDDKAYFALRPFLSVGALCNVQNMTRTARTTQEDDIGNVYKDKDGLSDAWEKLKEERKTSALGTASAGLGIIYKNFGIHPAVTTLFNKKGIDFGVKVGISYEF